MNFYQRMPFNSVMYDWIQSWFNVEFSIIFSTPENNMRAPNSSIYQKILENEHNGENQCDFKTYFSKMCCTMIWHRKVSMDIIYCIV